MLHVTHPSNSSNENKIETETVRITVVDVHTNDIESLNVAVIPNASADQYSSVRPSDKQCGSIIQDSIPKNV